MRKTIILLLCILYGINLKAQKGEPSGFHIGLGLEGALPSRGFNVNYSGGAGATLRLSKGITENFGATITSGAIAFFPKTRNNPTVTNKASLFIPIKAGAKLQLSESLYLLGELGVTLLKSYIINGGTNISPTFGYVNNSYFTYAPSIGADFSGVDVSLRYENLHGSGFVALRAGYNF